MSLTENLNDEHFGPDIGSGIGTGEARDFFQLLKPRVMSLVIFTALVGMVLAPGDLHPFLAAIGLLCIAVGAGASGALNMWYDADIDGEMTRTAKRPIPAGKVTAQDALSFGVVLSVLSVMTLGVLVNWVAAGLLAFTIFFYAVIYTMWLKRSTPQNIVIGGAAGAFPPMVGWSVMTGTVSLESIVLFAIIFMWTPPHFWALALFKMRDYGNVGVPMMPNVAGETSTRRQMMVYSILLAPIAVLPSLMGYASLGYGVFAAAAGAWFVWLNWLVIKHAGADDYAAEKRLFKYSIIYLFGIFAALLVDGVAQGMIG